MDPIRKKVLRIALGLSGFVALLNLSVPFTMIMLFRWALPSDSLSNIPLIVMVGVAGLVFMTLFDRLRFTVLRQFARYLDATLGERLLLQKFRDRALGKRSDAQRALNDLKRVRQFLGSPTAAGFLDAMMMPMMLVLVFVISPIMGVVALLCVAVMLLLKAMNRRNHLALLQRSQRQKQRADELAQQGVRYAQTVQAMGMRPHLLQRWQRLQSKVTEDQSQANEKSGVDSAATTSLGWIMQVVMMGIGYGLIFSGTLDGGGVIIAVIIAARVIMPLQMVANGWQQYLEARDAYHNLNAFITDMDKAATARESLTLPAPQGTLHAEQLIYRAGEAVLLKGVSFGLKPGQVMGMVGASGAGKTTLARVLTGALRPQSGLLRLDGADMHRWDQDELGQYIGYLPQNVELFPGTIADNIARFQVPDPARIERAAQRAGVAELISRLPAGYETRLEEEAINLPGGLRQRIALARALYPDPALLILDEPDAYLDQAGLDALIQLLRQAPGQRMTVVIATHKMPLLQFTQLLLVLKQGQAVQFGPSAKVIKSLIAPVTKPAAAPSIPLRPAAQS
jgi:PrtD family type I secretion system ABC transporter